MGTLSKLPSFQQRLSRCLIYIVIGCPFLPTPRTNLLRRIFMRRREGFYDLWGEGLTNLVFKFGPGPPKQWLPALDDVLAHNNTLTWLDPAESLPAKSGGRGD
ncbi:hypothetical protein J6590_015888 [Homalodisca vitripennis]|nr:hypothetical protein J6590_015888 [Homalodisca vitripennis]